MNIEKINFENCCNVSQVVDKYLIYRDLINQTQLTYSDQLITYLDWCLFSYIHDNISDDLFHEYRKNNI